MTGSHSVLPLTDKTKSNDGEGGSRQRRGGRAY